MLPVPKVLAALLVSTLPSTGGFQPAGEPVAALTTVPPAQAQVPEDAARLVPGDAHVLVRLESVQSALELVNTFATMATGGALTLDAHLLLSQLDVPGDVDKIAPDKPLLMCFSIGPAGPVTTLVLPVTDAAGYAASLPAGDAASGEPGRSTARSGGYVGVSTRAGYAAAAEPSLLAKGLRPGIASVHVDLKTLIATFRPIIEDGLDSFEGALDQMGGAQATPFDMTPMFEAYIDGIWAFVDSAESLDLGLEKRGQALELAGTFTALEKSQLAGFGGEGAIDLSAYPGALQPESSFAMVAGCDWKRLLTQLGPFLDGVVGMYPEPFASNLDRYMDAFTEAYGLMGPVVAASGDLGPDGMRLSYFLRSEKPGELLAAMEKALGSFEGEGTGMSISAPQRIEVGGQPATQYRMVLDVEKLIAQGAGAEPMDAEAAQEMRDMLSAFWGKDGLRFVLAQKGDLLAVVLGNDEAYVRGVLAALGAPKKPLPADFQRALAAASGGTPAVAYRIDYGRIFSQMKTLGALLGPGAEELSGLPDLPLPLTFWGSIRGRVWHGGMSTDLDSLIAFARAASQSAAPSAGEEDR